MIDYTKKAALISCNEERIIPAFREVYVRGFLKGAHYAIIKYRKSYANRSKSKGNKNH